MSAQMIFDTLQLQEMEIFSGQLEESMTAKTTSIDSLSRSEYEQSNLAGLLADNSVVFVKSYGRGSLATASFRGTAASHTQVLWNGFQLSSPMLGQVDLSFIPNKFFDQIQLKYGGSSLESTSGALGGSIELMSDPTASKPKLDIAQMFGSYQTYVTTAAINLQLKKLISDTRFNFQSSKNNFEYLNNGILPNEWMKQENSELSNIGFTQQFSYLISSTQQISLNTWNQWNKRNIPATMTNVLRGGNQTEFQDDFFSRNVLKWSLHQKKTRLQVSAAWFHEDQQYFLETTDEENSVTDTLIDSRNKSNVYFAKAKLNQDIGKNFMLIVGFDFRRESVKTSNYAESKHRNLTSVFASIEKSFWKRLNLNILLRQEMVDSDFLPPMPFLGASYKLLPNDDLYFRVNFSGNYHLPTLNDLYWEPGGNENLEPEQAYEFEGGLNYKHAFNRAIRLVTDLSFFTSNIKNWIQWKPGNYQYWSPENIAQVHARGIEASLQLKGVLAKVNYQLQGDYAYTLTTDESDLAREKGYAGQQLIYIPVHNANGFAYAAYNNFYLRWSLNYTDERKTSMNASDDFPDVLPAYWLNDVSLGKIWKMNKISLEVKGKVNNIFNVNYQAILWRAMPGRNFEVSLRFLMY